MTAPSKIASGVGFRYCQVLALATDDYPAATSTTMYTGVTVSGARTMTINDPEPRQIVHVGDDRPFAMDVLPPLEPITGSMVVSKQNDNLDTIIQGVNNVTLGEAVLYPIGTDKRGNENQVVVLAYRQAVDTDPASTTFGKRVWQSRLFPRAYVIPLEPGFTDDPEARNYTMRPQFATKYPWGVAFTTGTEGCVQAQGFRILTNNKPALGAINGNNTSTTFTLATPAVTTASMNVWKDGVLQTSGDVTLATNSLVFSTAPATNANVVVFWEHA